MDRQSMQLRGLIKGRRVELHDVYNGRHESFVVHDTERQLSGIIVIKGTTPFERIYVPSEAVSDMIEKGYCRFTKTHDTRCLEYRIRICEDL